MGRSSLKVKGYTPEQIQDIITENKDYKTGMRLYAVYQMALGKSSREVGNLFHRSSKQITNWVHRFEQQGVAGLLDKPGRGVHPGSAPPRSKRLPRYCSSNQPTMTITQPPGRGRY